MKNPFGQIVSFEDYVDIIGIPKEQLNSEEVKNRINKWLVQATEQFDSMISGNGQLGRLYRWFEKLEDNEEDNYKKYKLIKAICSWVETFVIKGKFWVDGLPVINSNVDIQINSSSNDSNVEAKRKDIIQDLVSVGLYQTTNFGDNNTFQDNQQNAEQLIEDLIVLSTSELQQNYLRLNPQKSLEGNLDFANNDLVNGGNIIGSTQHARNNIQYYNIIDSTIDLNKNTIIGTLGQDPTTAADIAQINQNIANINQEQITQNTNISNNANEINSIKAKDIEQNNRLTQLEQETEDNFNEIANIKTKDQQQDNSIQTNTNKIQENKNNITALDGRLLSVSGLLTQTIEGLRTYKPFQYVGDYQNGTSYNINQLVSYNNNLYLSKEDNNTTTPPNDKWLLINKDTVSVDLSDYPTKLEVEAIKNNLQQSITSNTTNITNLNNEAVKIAGTQTITGAKTFNNNVVIYKNGTPLALRAVNPGKIYMLMKGADDNANFSLGADSSNTSLEVNRGDLTIKTQQANKNIAFENAARIKFNRSVLEMGTEINAGFGGGEVKFIPEDNSTKTLKFYNNQPNDTRRFKLLVPEPTEAQNPATKNYVDTAIANSGGSGGGIPQQTLDQINNNTNNIVDLGNRTTSLENNTLSKTITTAQTVAGPVSFTQPITVATPIADTHAATKQYVDNLDNQNVKLTTDQTINGVKTFTNQIIANQGLKTAASQTITSGNLELGFGATFAYITPENGDAKALKFSGKDGRGKFDLDMGSASKITNLPEPINDQDAATKNYVDNAIANSGGSGGSIPQQTLDQINNNKNNITALQGTVNTNTTNITNLQNRVDTNARNIANHNSSIVDLQTRTIELETNSLDIYKSTEQVVEGPVTFRQRVSVPTTPRSASDVTNKTYVDNLIQQIPTGEYQIIYNNNSTINNLQTSSINIANYSSITRKPWIIQFDRYGNNGNKYEGTIYYNFLLPDINNAVFAGNSFWYNSTNKRFESGANAGITILRTNTSTLQLTIQCWDGGNRIRNVRLLVPSS